MQRSIGHTDTRRNPDNLRFTKRTIDLNFPGQLDCENIYDVLYALETGKLNTRGLPCLRVITYGGQLWTLDNKLLYIYRISPKVKRISVVQVSGQRFLDKFLHENSAVAIERMASSEFFPEVGNCGKYPRAEPSFRSACVQSSIVKHLEKGNIGMKRLPAPKSSSSVRSVSSSRTMTSRISSENTEAGTSSSLTSLSVVSECVHSDSKTSITSSTDLIELSSEDALDSDTCYPAVRSMTSEQLHLKDYSLAISAEDKTESTTARIRRSSFTPVVAERPSTCQASSRFSPGRFPSATWAIRSEKSSEETKRELRSLKTAPSGRVSPDKFRENFFRRWCRPASPDIVSGTTSAKFLANFRDNNAPQCFSTKFQDAAQETVSQNFSSKLGIGEDEPDDPFKMEAFVLPNFCYTPPSMVEESVISEEEIFSITEKRNGNHTSPTPGRLDRSVSSCSSSTERPTLQHPLSGSEGGLHGTSQLPRRSGIGLYGSPLRRASVSAGGTLKCNLEAEQEFRVPKQILLKHMKKAFFSVC